MLSLSLRQAATQSGNDTYFTFTFH